MFIKSNFNIKVKNEKTYTIYSNMYYVRLFSSKNSCISSSLYFGDLICPEYKGERDRD